MRLHTLKTCPDVIAQNGFGYGNDSYSAPSPAIVSSVMQGMTAAVHIYQDMGYDAFGGAGDIEHRRRRFPPI
jgi:hypothetical protein